VLVTVLLGSAGAALTPTGAGTTLAPPGDGALRVAAFNVHSGYDVEGRFDPEAVAEVLLAEDVDLVVLNEVDRGWLLEGGHDLLTLLGDRLRMPERAFAPAADEVWGNAILSRVPLSDVRVERLPSGGAPMDRSLISAVVEVGPGRPLAIVGAHLHHVTDEPDVRLAQARSIAAVSRLHSRDLPVAVLGDLNAPRDATELEPLGFLTDAVPGGTPTFPADDPQRRLDHVLMTPQVSASDRSIPETAVSDHRPVIVTLRPPTPDDDED
jgi:endonuclease/exonuclease/phosphatase family metal-dependent hydrolase